jgi:[ribosomal protein S18]-alanine N-acetyltransferase
MTAAAGRLAAIHAASFTLPRPWSEPEIASLLASPGVFVVSEPGGFAMGRVVLDETELLTLAVEPAARRQGLGRALLARFGAEAAAAGATRAFLEVAVDNLPAIGLYASAGYREAGRRRGYYHTPGGASVDAVIMVQDLAES